MFVSVPIYVESRRAGEGEPSLFHVRPLFRQFPTHADGDLELALQKITRDVRQTLNDVARGLRHETLAEWVWNPHVTEYRCNVAIDLRTRVVNARFLFILFEKLERRIAFCPSIDDVWFEIGRGQTVESRAERVLTEHFRQQEREAYDESFVRPEEFALDGSAWATTLEVDIQTEQTVPSPDKMIQAMLGGRDVTDGAAELSRCGRCLNWQPTSEVLRTVGREQEITDLERRLSSSDRRPVLLLGERLSGKTAVITEYVARKTELRKRTAATRGNVWLLSPQRLIAGMSYVGQWESRLLSILKYAQKKHLILYFDDFLGLYLAGRSRDSSLNMATVLKPYLERRECRFLAEMSPEAWRILKERDRGLADLFDILPIRPTNRDETAKIAMSVRRQLESQHRCRFQIDALTTVLDLQERFAADAAFPGKAVVRMKEIASQHSKATINSDRALDTFCASSGLRSWFLDPRTSIVREQILRSLQTDVVGQDAAVSAVADILTAAKAKMNDPHRPLGTLLFVGPTGVGKTQLAKATAKYLFGGNDRLVRFDLNQFVHAGAAAKLVGTFDQPDGLLTGAIRRSPFSVLLLDEIEKAHPEVFDLLLQVLGEGRLTDALGRTVSFTNTVIVMTSNLGVRESERQMGFAPESEMADDSWIKTIERFFRPEFFNRIDRVVPFQRLSKDRIREVALHTLNEVLRRDGLMRRQAVVVVEPLALEQLVHEGYSTVWGARGLKRTLERQLVQPLAHQLAKVTSQSMTQLNIYPAAGGVAVHLTELTEAAASPDSLASGTHLTGSELIDRVNLWLAELKLKLDQLRPPGPVSASEMSHEQHVYYSFQERHRQITQLCMAIEKGIDQKKSVQPLMNTPGNFKVAKIVPRHLRVDRALASRLRDAIATEQFQSMLESMEPDSTGVSDVAESHLLRLATIVHAEWQSLNHHSPDRAVLFLIPPLRSTQLQDDAFPQVYLNAWTLQEGKNELDWGLDAILHGPWGPGAPYAIELKGWTALVFARSETGYHIESLSDRGTQTWTVLGLPLDANQSIKDHWDLQLANRANWLNEMQRDPSLTHLDPLRMKNVIRTFESNEIIFDFRTSQISTGGDCTAFLKSVIPDALSLPESLRRVSS